MTQPLNILLVEDDNVEVMGIQRALKKAKIHTPLRVADDGSKALKILRGDGTDPIKKPYIILLDLNLPKINGLEFLEELRKDPVHKNAVVFVLTTSKREEDRRAAYGFNIAGYVVKSDTGDGFLKTVSMLEQYWNNVVLP